MRLPFCCFLLGPPLAHTLLCSKAAPTHWLTDRQTDWLPDWQTTSSLRQSFTQQAPNRVPLQNNDGVAHKPPYQPTLILCLNSHCSYCRISFQLISKNFKQKKLVAKHTYSHTQPFLSPRSVHVIFLPVTNPCFRWQRTTKICPNSLIYGWTLWGEAHGGILWCSQTGAHTHTHITTSQRPHSLGNQQNYKNERYDGRIIASQPKLAQTKHERVCKQIVMLPL